MSSIDDYSYASAGSRLQAISYFLNRNGWIAQTDALWLRNWLGKDGKPSELLKEAMEQHKIALVTERLTRGSHQSIQTPNVLASPF